MDYMIFILIAIIPGSFSSMNLARGKSALQSSTNGWWHANKAVDGVIERNNVDRDVSCECCSHTKLGEQKAWWQVDLGGASRIQRVKIFYRKLYTQRFAGFSLHLSNRSNTGRVLCYRHTGRQLPDPIQNINCSYTARYVTIYNERLPTRHYPETYSKEAVMELCEVEVYGCPLRKYGANCNLVCSVGCNDITYVCEPDTGYCVFGCKEGFTGFKCNDCKPGIYGRNCDKSCSDGCSDVSCDRYNGNCINGCKDNYSGENCRDCLDGRYGDKCGLNCPKNCLNKICHRFTGNCEFGCNVNWNGSKCQDCSVGLFGENCKKNCSIGCVPGGCNRTGHCYHGCYQRFDGNGCDSCIKGYFGYLCKYNCSANCVQTDCDRETGDCIGGCSVGWEGATCNISLTSRQSAQEDSNPVPTVIGVVVVVVLVLVVVILAFVLNRKRRTPGRKPKIRENILDSTPQNTPISQDSKENKMTDTNKTTDVRNDRNGIYENTAEVYYNLNVPGIPITEIKDYISQKTRADFEKEFSVMYRDIGLYLFVFTHHALYPHKSTVKKSKCIIPKTRKTLQWVKQITRTSSNGGESKYSGRVINTCRVRNAI